MSSLTAFHFETSLVRTVNISDTIYFIAKDIALSLGYERPADAVHQHCKSAKSLKSLGYGDLPIPEIIKIFGTTSVTVIPEADVYRLVMRSKLPSAERFKDWVVEEVLPTIRKTGSYGPSTKPQQLSEALVFFEAAARILNMSETSKIRGLTVVAKDYKLNPKMLPEYVSTEDLTKAMGDLLKDHCVPMSAIEANRILESKGYITTLKRRSSNGNFKEFKSITKKGLPYGRNETSVQSPNQTHPRWYVGMFKHVVDILL